MAKRDELLDHDYDGIKEYDNPLPNWWLWLFYGTVLFALIYTPYILFGFGDSTGQEYEKEVAAAMERYPALAQAKAPPSAAAADEAAAPAADVPSLEGNAEAIKAGAVTFAERCGPCHGPQGQGLIGPNLTDKFWIHGNSYDQVVSVITNGVVEKGMIAWKTMLNPTKIREVAAYVKTLQGSNPPNPKAPEGKEYSQ